ncbi:MAG TPA: GAF domain-containing protein, partial [Aggregatilineales bacterium]|nr:GAF domain-containing protein [Aggregatilineales bacterium]
MSDILARVPGGRIFVNMAIGGKLTLGFGIIVILTLVVVGLSFLGSRRASQKIDTTSQLRAPLALASSKAQADLLTMLSDVRGYLALGDPEYREGYAAASQAFEADLIELERLLSQNDPNNAETKARLDELQIAYEAWSAYPDRLFTLRDDQLQSEPALRILIQDASPLIASIMGKTNVIIHSQSQREPTAENMVLLSDMAEFQASFYAIVAGLRGYVTTGRSSFKFEYTSNVAANEEAWGNLAHKRESLAETQQALLNDVEAARKAFFELPDQMFAIIEGDRAREDLYLFRTEAVPLAEQMLQLLTEITQDQQNQLQSDLNEGNDQLSISQQRNLLIGLVAVLVAIGLSFVIQRSIVGPIERLIAVAQNISAGQLTARATVEANDEIGTLAATFNTMTGQLSGTLDDLESRRREQAEIAEKLQRQNEYLSALHQTALGMISRLDLNELLEALMTRVGQLLDTPHGFIFLTNPDHPDIIELKIGKGVFIQEIGRQTRVGEGLAGKVWQSGEPLVVEDYDAWEGRLTGYAYQVIGITVAVPLIRPTSQFDRRTDAIGVIGIAYDPGVSRTFGDEELEPLMRFSELASIAIDNARLYAAAQEARAVAEATRDSLAILNSTLDLDALFGRFLELVDRVVPYTAASILLIEGEVIRVVQVRGYRDSLVGVEFPLASTPNMRGIVETGKPSLIRDTRLSKDWVRSPETDMIRSSLTAGIKVDNKVIGFVSVESDQPNAFDTSDVKQLETFGGYASIAVQNARLFAEAEAARAVAEAADQSKSDFLSSVSHELRTPLTSVLGFARIIQKELKGRVFPSITTEDRKVKRAVEGISEDLGIIIMEGERLTTLINNVLDLAKIEAGKIEWHMETLAMPDVIERATAATSALFEQKGLALIKDFAPSLPPVIGTSSFR